MLINLSNHPYTDWDEKQREAATIYGEVVDLPFPAIDAMANEIAIAQLASDYATKVKEKASKSPITVHIMGEMSFCFALVSELLKVGIPCIVSTSQRNSEKIGKGKKQISFNFLRFRKYFVMS